MTNVNNIHIDMTTKVRIDLWFECTSCSARGNLRYTAYKYEFDRMNPEEWYDCPMCGSPCKVYSEYTELDTW